MDFSWTAEQVALKDKVIAFARESLSDRVLERDTEGEFPHVGWRKCAEFGIQSMAIPAEFNSSGVDTDLLSATLAMEALGYGCRDNGLTFALNTQMWTVQYPIHRFGTDAQKREYLPKMCAGELIGAHAITERESGSDVFALQTHAKRVDGGYLLNGTKRFVSLGPIADLALMFVTLDPSKAKWGVTALLVPTDSPGLKVSAPQQKMGLGTVPMGDIVVTDCFVAEANRLGPEGAGASISTSCLGVERCFILASHLGAMEHQLENAIHYARTRRQFGQPIGKFQSVSNRVADMKLRLETARLLLYQVAWLSQQNKSVMLESALLKLHLSESFVASSMDALRIHGGNGYLREFEVERDLRDSIGGVLYAGTTDIQRVLIARILGL